MNAQLTVNGHTISIELTQEQIEQLTKKKPMKKWEDLEEISGFFVHPTGFVNQFELHNKTSCMYVAPTKAIYATENQARSALAMAQLSQLMKDVNGEWKPKYNGSADNYNIEFWTGSINTDYSSYKAEFLTFPTSKIRDQFIEDHKELIEEYFLMHK